MWTEMNCCIGQASHALKQRYQEHIRYIKQNDPQSAYALHILSNNHERGPINNTMTMIKQIKKNHTISSIQSIIHSFILPPQTTHTRTKHRRAKPFVPTDHWPTYYITTCQAHQSVLPHYHCPDPVSFVSCHKMVCTTSYCITICCCIFWDAFNVLSFN